MNDNVVKGLTLFFWNLLTDCPWVVLGAMPIWDKLRVKKSTMICWIVLVGLFMPLGTGLVRIFFYGQYFATLAQLVKIIFYMLIVIFFLRGFTLHWAQLIFVFLFLQSISTFINSASMIVNTLALGSDAVISIGRTPTYPGLIVLLNIPAFLILMRYFKNTLRPVLESLSKRDSINLLGVPILFLVVNLVLNSLDYSMTDHVMVGVFNLLVMAAGIASYFLIIRLLRENGRRTSLEVENRDMVQLLELQKRSFAQLSANIEAARTQRHDMRFHLSVLSGCLKKRDYEKLGDYLSEYSRGLKEYVMPSICENHAVDILARHFVGQIAALGIKTDVKLDIPAEAKVPDAELCVIFGNLFENALHSLEQQQMGEAFLTVRSETSNGTMVIAIDNSCPDMSPIEHGIGLNSVTAVVSRFGGTAQFEKRGGTFRASVIMYY